MAHCDRCERWFVHSSALEEHMEHSNSHWACHYCDLDFESYEALRQHYILSPNHDMEDSDYWACHYCDLDFESHEALKRHYRLSPNHHYCKKCDRYFKFEESRRQPMDVKHWHCKLHDRVFKSESALHSHYQQSVDHGFSIECDQDSDDEDELWDDLVEDQRASASRACHEQFDSYPELQQHGYEEHDSHERFDSYPELQQHDHEEHDSHERFDGYPELQHHDHEEPDSHERFDGYPELQHHDHEEPDSHELFDWYPELQQHDYEEPDSHELFDRYPELQQCDHEEHNSFTEFENEERTRPSFEAQMAESSSSTATGPSSHLIKLTVLAVNSLVKRDIFSLPNPFAVIRIDGFDLCQTAIIKKTLSPYWNETFDLAVRASSTIQIQVFDHRKFKRNDQGFLGSVSITVGDYLNLNQGGSTNLTLQLQPRPYGKIVGGILMFSLATDSEGQVLPQQLDLAQSFNNMRVSPSSTTHGNGNTLPSHNTHTTNWAPRPPSTVHTDAPQNRHDYQRKVVDFRSQPEMRLTADATCDVCVRRGSVFEDSFAAVMRLRPEDLRKRLVVKFEGEDGLDYGGVSREWFFLLSHEMFNPSYGLFEYSAHDNYTLQINPASGVNAEHLDYFKFIGRVLGLAVFHNRFLDAYFVPGFYKVVLEKKVNLKDLEAVDGELYKSLTWMLENNITGVLEETFSVMEDRFGEHVVVELRPGGATQDVTEANKRQYVDLVAVHRITGRIAEQFRALMEGLGDVLPLSLLRVFDEHELELLIGGMTEIDMDDWAQFTDYRGYERTDRVIEWFWACLRSWPAERKARLLQFTTGTSRVPVNGFEHLQGSDGPRHFTIAKSGDPSGLPCSHTCFNRLDLPPYEDYESLERKLRFAIEETEGFGQE